MRLLTKQLPEIGTVASAVDIGRIGRNRYTWQACVDCGKERWVSVTGRNGQSKYKRCLSCGLKAIHLYGEKSSHWKGGRSYHKSGYILITIQPNDFFHPMVSKGGQVLEHRLVMAKHIQRCLLPWEVVHHKNGIKDDNRIENLELLSSQRKHFTNGGLIKRLRCLERQVATLEEKNRILESKLGGVKCS